MINLQIERATESKRETSIQKSKQYRRWTVEKSFETKHYGWQQL